MMGTPGSQARPEPPRSRRDRCEARTEELAHDAVQDLVDRQRIMSSHRSRLAHVVIDVGDLDGGVAFWSAALDAVEEPLDPASSTVYRRLRLPDTEVRVLLQLTADPKVHKERMHLDIETDDVEAEVRRLEGLGATRWDHQQERGHDFWVLRDPWDNEFCVLQPEFPELLARRPPWSPDAPPPGR